MIPTSIERIFANAGMIADEIAMTLSLSSDDGDPVASARTCPEAQIKNLCGALVGIALAKTLRPAELDRVENAIAKIISEYSKLYGGKE